MATESIEGELERQEFDEDPHDLIGRTDLGGCIGWHYTTSKEPSGVSDWILESSHQPVRAAFSSRSLAQRLYHAVSRLDRSAEQKPRVLGGMVVLKGTRFPLARVFAEVADDESLSAIAEEYDLEVEQLRDVFLGLATYLEINKPRRQNAEVPDR